LVDHKKTWFLFSLKFANQDSSTNARVGKWFSHGAGNRRFGKTTKTFLAIALICIVFVSIFVFMPKEKQNANANPNPTDKPSVNPSATQGLNPNPTLQPIMPPPINPPVPQDSKTPGIVESAQPINSSTWMTIARSAWTYYQIGVGVDRNTGLPWTGRASQYFTDWDLGVYIQAVVDAAKLGLIDNRTFTERTDKVMTWLETRELNNASYPYWFYQATDGQVWHQNSDVAGFIVDVADTGRMFVALYNLKTYSQEFAPRVNDLVYNHNGNRSDYAALVPGLKAESLSSTSIYSYYVIGGFECFWPSELAGASAQVLKNMFAPSTGTVTTDEGVTLPKVRITGDPLLCAFFELSNKDANLGKLVNLTFSAHEAYYNATGNFRAFGEGPTFSTDWQWEWVTLPDGRTWTPLNGKGETLGVSPLIYTKIAWSFLALHNTNYTRSMAIYLEQKMPSPTPNGYNEAVDENGAVLNAWGSLTNGLILDAARYYITNTPY
jgi:hypothetical protein